MSELPPDVVLLWGLQNESRRGPKPSLSIEDITQAAIELADAEGLAAVSMARVAERLGNSTMALYRHVKSKDELLTLMSDAALEQPDPLPEGVDWRTGLTFWADNVLTVIRRHRWYAQLPIPGPPTGPKNLAWFDAALGALADTGLSEEAKVGVVMGLITYVQGEVRLSLDLAAGFADNPEAFSRYGATLARVVDPRRLPALARVLEAGVFQPDLEFEQSGDADFDFGLQLYLDGIANFIERTCQDGADPAPAPGAES
ncbi:transcriptional regulator, TetR family [Kribbella flavida DSM 17836]|uniref:Transcriptional regulator, TetR family n=1 Tax=Kribbella flavida (strain DSM 17836 / JCM 10339 / NBRC 14399) TaxID=479435 RepID=D2PL49_KRIFD|nr:TetR/AcrR family transcriptional regulator [Kribbella flavida]ADB34304.1 transcriptional regulator, TetR family [Kribbella flavida DSM 17836]